MAAAVCHSQQPTIPSFICTNSTSAAVRNAHPNTAPAADATIPARSTRKFKCPPQQPSWASSPARMASLRAEAMRLEKRKALKEYTCDSIKCLPEVELAAHEEAMLKLLLGSAGFKAILNKGGECEQRAYV